MQNREKLSGCVLFGFLLAFHASSPPLFSEEMVPPESPAQLLGLPQAHTKNLIPTPEDEILALYDSGKKRKAFRAVNEWIKQEKKKPAPYVTAAHLYFKSGKPKKCLKYAKKALKKMPQHAVAFYWKGRAYEALDKPMEAANEYQAALFAREEYRKAKEGLDRVLALLNGEGGQEPEYDAYPGKE